MNKLFVTIVCSIFISILLSTSVISQTFVGPEWQSQPANTKHNALDQVVTGDTDPGSFPSALGLAELFIESMNTSFDTFADDMPSQFPSRRPKLIHSVGVIMSAKWQAYPNSFTGILGTGCSNLYVRLSLAKAPATGEKGYAPGLSLKCLRDGVHSGNLFAMYSLQGQDSWNFFKHDLTNHVPDVGASAGIIIAGLRSVFAKASNYPVMIGLSDLARYDERGTNHTSPSFPFRLIFHPVTAIHNSFPDDPQNPFEEILAQGLQNPGPLYEVYAEMQPNDPMSLYKHVGTLVTTTPATTSNFADSLMFFQHTRMEEDLALVPDWQFQADAIMEEQRNTDYFTYPDLPFN